MVEEGARPVLAMERELVLAGLVWKRSDEEAFTAVQNRRRYGSAGHASITFFLFRDRKPGNTASLRLLRPLILRRPWGYFCFHAGGCFFFSLRFLLPL